MVQKICNSCEITLGITWTHLYIYDLCWVRLACQFWPLVTYFNLGKTSLPIWPLVIYVVSLFSFFCYVFMNYVVSMQYIGQRKFRGENCNCVTVGDNVRRRMPENDEWSVSSYEFGRQGRCLFSGQKVSWKVSPLPCKLDSVRSKLINCLLGQD